MCDVKLTCMYKFVFMSNVFYNMENFLFYADF